MRVFGFAAQTRLLNEFFQFYVANFGKFLFSCKNIHGELFEVCQVELVHLVERRGVFHELHLVTLQGSNDFIHVRFGLVVFGAHGLDFVCAFLEEAEDAFFFGSVEAAQFDDHAADQVAHLPQVLRAHAGERGFGEVCHFLLGPGSVLENHAGITHVDLLREVVYHAFFLVAQHAVVERGWGFFFGRRNQGGRRRRGRSVAHGGRER